MQFLNFKNKPIINKIVFPILAVFILIGGTLYYFNLKAISDFAEELIKKDILNYAHELYSVCDQTLTDLLYEGKADDEKSIVIAKGTTLDSIETFARHKDIEILIYSNGNEVLKTGIFDKAAHEISYLKEEQVLSIYINNERYYVYLFEFKPWRWQILIATNPYKYLYIENKVHLSYIISSIIFIISLLFIVISLNKSIRNPIISIIQSLNNNTLPDYKGTKEIEFLSNNIRLMMNSLDRRIKELENKEKEISEAKEFNEAILNSISDPISIREADSLKIISANNAFINKFKKEDEEIIGRTCYDTLHNLSHKCPDCPPTEKLKEGKPFNYETKTYDKDGVAVTLDVSASPFKDKLGNITHLIFVARDITERRHLEEQLRQSQKIESIGILAGGIAHDFNNILTAIIGYGNLLQMKLGDNPVLNLYVKQILKSSDRAVNLVSSLLAFSRKQIVEPIPVELNEIIIKISKLLRRLLEENIELKINLISEKLMVMADPLQLEQVLMNLATNARDAMPTGGSLLIETDLSKIDEDFIKIHGYGKVGYYAKILVSDSGSGIDPKILKDIFDPFFTTKEVGKGTGLGLSMVYGIIKQHNGFINVYSELDKGTTFTIYLPLIKIEANKEKKTEIYKDITSELKGRETILIAEDESLVRELHRELLSNYGYKIYEAADGEEALKMFNEYKDEIELVLSDVVMPKKNGKELIKEIQKIKPDMKIILMSGYSLNLIGREGLIDCKIDFVSKPISPENLLKKIREVFDNTDSS